MFNGKKLAKLYKKSKTNRHALMLQLAERGMRVSYPTIMLWEKGKSVPDANELKVISDIFGVEMSFFLN